MFNLMEQGLAVQRMQVEANRFQYTRTVEPFELMRDVQLEAIAHHCFVWINGAICQTIISQQEPLGFHWRKVDPGQLPEDME